MTLTIELNPEEGARLAAAARQEGVAPADLARKLVTEHLPPVPAGPLDQPRIQGLNPGEAWMSDDFNAELPDEFWLGQE